MKFKRLSRFIINKHCKKCKKPYRFSKRKAKVVELLGYCSGECYTNSIIKKHETH